MSRGPGDRQVNFGGHDVPLGGIVKGFAVFILLIIALYIGWSSFYRVEPSERAVVLRFGKYLRTDEPGPHFKIPLVDEALIVSVEEHGLRLPVERTPQQSNRYPTSGQREQESLVLTGQLDAAVVEWTLQWEVVEPDKYLFSMYRGYQQDHMQQMIETSAVSVMNRLVGDYSLDEIRASRRGEIEAAAQRSLQEEIDRYECGIQIKGLQLQRVTPPAKVAPSYDEVLAAIQNQQKLINEANQERNRLLPRAEASKDRLIREAEGYAARIRGEAEGEIQALLAKYRAYKEAPEVTRQRLYLEAMEKVLSNSGSKIVLDEELRGLLPLLDLGGQSVQPAALKR